LKFGQTPMAVLAAGVSCFSVYPSILIQTISSAKSCVMTIGLMCNPRLTPANGFISLDKRHSLLA
jgi:hypothetical protein